MKQFGGYKKKNLTADDILLANGGNKDLGDFVGSLYWNSGTKTLQIRSVKTNTYSDLVTFGSNAFNSTSYLPLSGGTMTGPITINSSVNNNYNEGLRITRAGNSWAGITFGSTGTSGAPTNGWFAATNPSNQFIINPDNSGNTGGLCLNKDGDLKWRNQTVIHSGNISSQTVANATNCLKNYGASTARPNGNSFTLPGGANAVQMRSGATSGNDIGIFHLSDDNCFICNSSDDNYTFAVFDTDKTADFSNAANSSFAVLSDKGGCTVNGNLIIHAGNIGSQSVNYATRAAYLDGHGTNPDNSHPGYGARVFYSWNSGQAGNSSSGYSNGITIGSHPSDQAYGFQIVQNMWDDRTYTRRYNGGWQEWKTLAWTSDLSSYLPLSGGTMTGDLITTGVKASGTSNRLIFRHLDGQNCNGDYNLYLQYHQSDAVTYFNGGTYYIKGGYYNGTSAAANSVAWGNVSSKPFNWSGQSGQPTWLWGSNDGSNYYVWNPSNFSVNYASSAGTASYLNSPYNTLLLQLRDDPYKTVISYRTYGNEALVFAAKQSVTSYMFFNGVDLAAGSNWHDLGNPALQIKLNCVYVNSLIGQDVSPSYNFYVNGTAMISSNLYVGNRNTRTGIFNLGAGGNTPSGYTTTNAGGNQILGLISWDGSSDEGGILVGSDCCIIYNSSDSGYLFKVVDKDISSALGNGFGEANVRFAITDEGEGKFYSNCYASNFYTSSDIRKKKNIIRISDNIRQFNWKETGELSYGFIAQELEIEHPELVDSKLEYKTVNYNSALSYYMAQLENRVKELENEIKLLKKGKEVDI